MPPQNTNKFVNHYKTSISIGNEHDGDNIQATSIAFVILLIGSFQVLVVYREPRAK
jgi:hypothetical protein